MAFTLSRIDRLYREYDVIATLSNSNPATLTGVDVALLPPRSAPTAATVWIAAGYAAGTATILFAGPDADSTGALVVPASADLWMRATDSPEVDAEKVERITVLGSGSVAAPLPLPQVLSVNGQTGAVSIPSLPPSGGAGGALSGSYPNPGLNEATVDNIVAADAADAGTATGAALRAALVRDEGPAVALAARRLPASATDLPELASAFTDGFAGSSLDPDRWIVVKPVPAGYRVTGGRLEIDTRPGGLYTSPGITDNVVATRAPEGSWQATVKVTGKPLNIQHFGIGVFQGREYGRALLLRVGRPDDKVRTQFTQAVHLNARLTVSDYSEQTDTAMPTTEWLRLVSDGETLTAWRSADGTSFTRVGRTMVFKPLPAAYIGLFAYDTGADPVQTVQFDDFVLENLDDPATLVAAPRLEQPTDASLAPADALSLDIRDALRLSDKWTLNTYYPTAFGAQSAVTYLDFGGTEEQHIRGPATAAFGLAASLATGAYSSTVTGVSTTVATETVAKLARSVAYRHAANRLDGGWGEVWQSAHWAAFAAQAAWLIWPSLPDVDRRLIVRMLVHEADRRLAYEPEFWKDRNGVVLSAPGDTKAEENAWNSLVLQAACAMMPDHPHRGAWSRRCSELLVTAYATPNDLTNHAVVDGRPVAAYLRGWNANNDGTVMNHDILHPDYMASIGMSLQAGVIFGLAGQIPPDAFKHNADLVYSALVDLTFASPPYDAPGGRIYTPGTGVLYYPDGSDYNVARYEDKISFDVFMDSFALAGPLSASAATWAQLHIDLLATQQARSATGQTFIDADGYTYHSREQWVAANLAWAWLARWVVATRRYFPTARTTRPLSPGSAGVLALEMRSGQYYTQPHTNTNSTYGAANGNLRGSRVTFGRDCVLNSLAIKVATAGTAGAVVRAGVWRWDKTASTWNLVLDAGTVDTTTTGVKTWTINLPVLADEAYFLACAGQGAPATAPILQGTSAVQSQASGDSSADIVLSNQPAGLQATGVTGAFTATTNLAFSTGVPLIAVRAA